MSMNAFIIDMIFYFFSRNVSFLNWRLFITDTKRIMKFITVAFKLFCNVSGGLYAFRKIISEFYDFDLIM